MVLTREPAADLASRIDRFWSVRGDGAPGTSFHEFFPDGSSNLIFRLSSSGCRLVLLGPATDLAAVERDRRAEYLGVRFRTGHTPALADVTPSELTNAHVELTRLGGVRVDDLAERLFSHASPESRQRALEELLRRAPPLVRSERARQLGALLDARGGRVRIDDLAGSLGLHVRALERLCVVEFGMSPKRLARLARFRHVLARLHAGGFGTLADLALECGYSDQPHLTRDFKDLTGRLPGERFAFQPRRLDAAPRTEVVHRHRDR